MARNILKLTKVSKIYTMDGEKCYALDNVMLEVKEGEFIAIIGPSGSGKSTLMHIMGCLDTPTEGSVFFDGEDISSLSERKQAGIRNKKIGFVFQQFNLLPKTSSLKNVELPLIYGRIKAKERAELAKKMLTVVGLKDKLENHPSQLSGGQQQRVAIARALVTNPTIIFADEPTGNLDTKSGREIMEIFKRLHKEKKTLVVVTHEEHIASAAKRIIRIVDGKIVGDKSN